MCVRRSRFLPRYAGGQRPCQTDDHYLSTGLFRRPESRCDITSTEGPLTPMVDKPREPESDSNPLLDAAGVQLYQSKVGSTLWVAIGTRPEVQFSTNILSRYSKSPLRGDMETI